MPGGAVKENLGVLPHFCNARYPPFGSLICYHRARMRYLRTEVPSLATGTMNCAANAAVFVYLYVEESISQSPPMGSFTCTVTGASLWLRKVTSNSISQVWVSMRL